MINGNQSGINLKKEEGCEFCLELKSFKFGNLGNFSQTIQDDLDKKISTYKITGEGLEDIKELKQDTKIFSATKELLNQIDNNTYIYETDGLIFTPTNLTVGEGEKKKINMVVDGIEFLNGNLALKIVLILNWYLCVIKRTEFLKR